ncbi:hypothetical protein ABZ208_36790 [Streptomyces sp. NPDC006208]|uniref:hypothetical protein n=1 Tax=Streptomyces sp. NPDC006208 TaxID=3156734 RepID=UPI0033BE564B
MGTGGVHAAHHRATAAGAEFDAQFADALRVERLGEGRVRLLLQGAVEERARELAHRESDCCSFFTVTFAREGNDTLVMEVTTPDEHAAVVEAMAARAEAAARGTS